MSVGRKVFVANVSFKAQELDLEDLFSTVGTVQEVNIIKDETGRSRGFAFVVMSSEEEAKEAISKLDQTEIFGRNLKVDLARERAPRDRRDRPREASY